MGKYAFAIAMLVTGGIAMPAIAQEAPMTAKEKAAKPKTGTISGMPGAASASYARCGSGTGAAKPTAGPEGACPATDAVADEHRTYTGDRRNDGAPTAAVEAAPAAGATMPSRLSMTPTTIKAVAPAAPQLLKKSINEKGVK